MALTTVQDLMDAMTDHGFSDTTTARKTELINDAYQDICSREAWPFLEVQATVNTVASTAAIVLPTDFRTALSLVINANSVVLMPKRLDDLTKQFAGNLTQVGIPSYYYFVGNSLRLYPIPDSIYAITLSYISAPAKLVNTTDVPLLPDRHARAILLGAVASAYDMEDDTDLALKFDQKFEKRIATMKYDLSMQQFDRPDTVYNLHQFDDVWDY